MKKTTRALALLTAVSLTFGSATVVSSVNAVAAEAQEQTMADLYDPYFNPATGRGSVFELPLLSDKPLPNGIKLSFPESNDKLPTTGKQRGFQVGAWWLLTNNNFDEPGMYWSSSYPGNNSFGPVLMDFKVKVSYPDGSSEIIETSASFEPDYATHYRGRITYPSVWIAKDFTDQANYTLSPKANPLPQGTRFSVLEDQQVTKVLDFTVNETTGEIRVTPLPLLWETQSQISTEMIKVEFPDGSYATALVNLDIIWPEPTLEPEPKPAPEPEPTPEPEPVPQPTDRSFGSSSS